MANGSTVSTCPLFPELENQKSPGYLDPKTGAVNIPGIFSVQANSILPQGVGSGTMTTIANVQMDWSEVFYSSRDEELRQKYPALQQAWEHYQNILKMCRSREEEEDAN